MASLKMANHQFLKILFNNRLALNPRTTTEQVKNEPICSRRPGLQSIVVAPSNKPKINSNRQHNQTRFNRFYFLNIWLSPNCPTTPMCIARFQMKESYGHNLHKKQLHPVLRHHCKRNQTKRVLTFTEALKNQSSISLKRGSETFEGFQQAIDPLSITRTRRRSCSEYSAQTKVIKSTGT